MTELEILLVDITEAKLKGRPIEYNTLRDRTREASMDVCSQYDLWRKTNWLLDMTHDECYTKIIQLIRARIEYDKSQRGV